MEKDKCYLCFEKETAKLQFIDPIPCNCKGSIKLHSSCAKELMNNSESCGICKAGWRFTGVKRILYPNGTINEEIHYVNGLKNGLHITYHTNGQVAIELNYINDVKEGPYKLYNKNGVLVHETNYINNKREGPYKTYYDNGALFGEGTFVNDRDCETSHKIYFDNGNVNIERKIYKVNESLYIELKEYYINGQLRKEKTTVNSRIHGIYKLYYPDGKIEMEDHYINGVIHKIVRYYKSGCLKKEMYFHNARCNGYSKEYYDGGSILSKREPGHYWAYYPNGTLKEECTCIASGPHIGAWDGIRSFYNEDGKLIKQIKYINGYHQKQ
jgi:antitoxin component YwqK of YwqJK toxin-antitoxin module